MDTAYVAGELLGWFGQFCWWMGIIFQCVMIWWGVRIAQRKGRDPLLGALLAFLLSLIGILILSLLSDRTEREKDVFGRNL